MFYNCLIIQELEKYSLGFMEMNPKNFLQLLDGEIRLGAFHGVIHPYIDLQSDKLMTENLMYYLDNKSAWISKVPNSPLQDTYMGGRILYLPARRLEVCISATPGWQDRENIAELPQGSAEV